MPVIVAENDRDRWLGGEDVSDLLGPYPADGMEIWPVSTAVNKAGTEGEELWKPSPLVGEGRLAAEPRAG